MPMRVPTVDGPSVAQQGLPGVRQSSVASPELLGAGARQMGALGEATQRAGSELAQLQAEQRRQFDALRVDDALNQAQEAAVRLRSTPSTGFADQTGVSALSRESGMPLAEEYTGKLKTEVDRIGGTLTPQQRQLYGMKANDVVRGFYGQALEHERTQRNEYTLSVRDATVAGAKSALALAPTDTKNVDFQVDRIRGAYLGGQDEKGNFIPGSAQMQGKSAAWAKERADEAVSDAHGNAIKMAMEQGNVNLAMAYFNRYSPQMTAKDVLEVQGRLQKDYDTRLGATVGDQVMERNRTRIEPNGYTRLTALVMDAESRGVDFAPDGSFLTSPKGATGRMQVTKATYTDPGYGIKPADLSGTKQQQADEIARVGEEKLAVMIKRYKGDVPKALAAYNWGEGNVDRAVAEAEQDRQTGAFRAPPGPDYWLTKLPKETRDYVAGISAKFGTGGGTPARPTLAELHDQARATLGPNASPLAVKNAEERITQRYTDQDKAVKQRSEEAYSRTLQALTQNGGNYPALPASLRADMTELAPGRIDDAMKFGTTVAAGQPVQTDWNTYTQLRAMAAANPAGFAKTDLRAYYDKLNPTQREQLLDIQTKVKDPKELPQVMALDSQLRIAHEQLGLKTSDGEKKGKFDDAVSHAISDEMQTKKRALTFEERDTIIKRMMLPTSAGSWFFNMGKKKVYEATGTPDEAGAKPTITDDARALISSALKAEGIEATEANITRRFNLRYGIR